MYQLSFNIIDDDFTMIEGEKLIHVKVNHGANYFANGYRIDNLTYISDCSFIPNETMDKISGSEIIILDALRSGKKHRSHFTLEEAIETAIKLNPKYVYFTDICHDIDHYETNKYLEKISNETNIKMQIAFDGQKIRF